MKKIAVVYHSANGHTQYIAQCVVNGARAVDDVVVALLQAESLTASPEELIAFDGLIWGSPTYFGGVTGTFKSFMDSTGKMWRNQQLRHKLASGFTVSSLPAGDKQSTLQSMFVFSMQHGMIWVGNPNLPEQHSGVPYNEAANRLGSWSGLMAQAGHASLADSFEPGDVKAAKLYGKNFALTLNRLSP